MPDMLVRLYNLPKTDELYAELKEQGITLKRVMTPNYGKAFAFIKETFSEGWAYEACAAIAHVPSGLFVAYEKTETQSRIVGFAAYDTTARDFFGPTGVLPEMRGKGVGKALLLRTLEAMRDEGYGYAIIGGVGPQEFYRKCCGATLIEDSSPGIYKDLF